MIYKEWLVKLDARDFQSGSGSPYPLSSCREICYETVRLRQDKGFSVAIGSDSYAARRAEETEFDELTADEKRLKNLPPYDENAKMEIRSLMGEKAPEWLFLL